MDEGPKEDTKCAVNLDKHETRVEEPEPSFCKSIFQQVVDERDDSSGPISLFCNIYEHFFNNRTWHIISLTVTFLLSIPCLIIGGIYFGSCHIKPFIPIYMIYQPIIAILRAVVGAGMAYCKYKWWSNDELVNTMHQQYFANRGYYADPILLTGFLISAGFANHAIYPIYDVYQGESVMEKGYCPDVLYMSAYWIQNLIWVVVAIQAVYHLFIWSMTCYAGLCYKDESNEAESSKARV